MMTNAKVGVAVVGGYLLGRTKKAKVAMGLGMFLAGRRMKLDPQQIKNLVTESPVFAGLNDQVRRELVDATKSAAGSALAKRANSLADSLKERTLGLNEPSSGSGPDWDDEFSEEDEQDEPGAAREAADLEPADLEPADHGGRTRAAARSSSASAQQSKSPTATAGRRAHPSKTGNASGRAKPAGAGSASGARRAAGGAAGKAASGTRKATGGAARKADTRGGEDG